MSFSLLLVSGLVKQDPKLLEDKILPPPSPRPKNSIFDVDEEKSKVNLGWVKEVDRQSLLVRARGWEFVEVSALPFSPTPSTDPQTAGCAGGALLFPLAGAVLRFVGAVSLSPFNHVSKLE